MRVFVFGTGRCGTVAVADAFRYATNYSVSHEAFNWLLSYPDNHIAVNPQLRMRMNELVSIYPEAIYVWLKRAQDKVARSYARLDRGRWLDRWWLFHNTVRPTERLWAANRTVVELLYQCERAWDYCPEDRRHIWEIEMIKPAFKALWASLECRGDLEAALASFDTPVNTSEQRGD